MEEFLKQIIKQIKFILKENFQFKGEDLPYYISIFISVIFFIAGINLFFEIAEELSENNLGKFDSQITELIIFYRSEALTPVIIFITRLGDFYSYMIITILIAIFFIIKKSNKLFILQIVSVNILAFIFNFLLKTFYGRDRPGDLYLVEATYMSFPSGHAMSAAAFYGFIIYLSVRYIKQIWIKAIITVISCLLIFAIGVSRIYLGVHYPSDVLAGFTGGLFWVTFCIIIFNILGLVRKRRLKRKTG